MARDEARMSGGGGTTVPIGYFLAANSAVPPKLLLLPINDGDAAEAAVVDAWIRIDPLAGLSRIFCTRCRAPRCRCLPIPSPVSHPHQCELASALLASASLHIQSPPAAALFIDKLSLIQYRFPSYF